MNEQGTREAPVRLGTRATQALGAIPVTRVMEGPRASKVCCRLMLAPTCQLLLTHSLSHSHTHTHTLPLLPLSTFVSPSGSSMASSQPHLRHRNPMCVTSGLMLLTRTTVPLIATNLPARNTSNQEQDKGSSLVSVNLFLAWRTTNSTTSVCTRAPMQFALRSLSGVTGEKPESRISTLGKSSS